MAATASRCQGRLWRRMTVSRLSPRTSREELERASGVNGLELLRVAERISRASLASLTWPNELGHVLGAHHARLVQDDGLRRKRKPPVVELPEETRERARLNPGLLLKLRGGFARPGHSPRPRGLPLARLRHR